MIIPKTIEALYNQIEDSLRGLTYEIDQALQNIADQLNVRFIKARIKPKESFLAKIEKDGYKNPVNEIEDLVACRLVINNISEIDFIKEKLEPIFNIEDEKSNRTNSPHEFIYDAVHLILSFKDNPLISNKNILNKKFELQIKTNLQNAIDEVTRTETYKTSSLRWEKDRTASEIRANLELLDILLKDFSKVVEIQEEREYAPYQSKNKIINLLKTFWTSEKLPDDLRRASIIIESYLKLANTTLDDLINILNMPKYLNIIKAISITPCQIILIVLFLEKETFINNVRRQRKHLLITDEMIDICPDLNNIEESYRINISL
jgi:ppGpp synthetase/RelA/SpoT-type nucleotidyltranferase